MNIRHMPCYCEYESCKRYMRQMATNFKLAWHKTKQKSTEYSKLWPWMWSKLNRIFSVKFMLIFSTVVRRLVWSWYPFLYVIYICTWDFISQIVSTLWLNDTISYVFYVTPRLNWESRWIVNLKEPSLILSHDISLNSFLAFYTFSQIIHQKK